MSVRHVREDCGICFHILAVTGASTMNCLLCAGEWGMDWMGKRENTGDLYSLIHPSRLTSPCLVQLSVVEGL